MSLEKHCKAYPLVCAEDIFKYIFQSAYGCEHLVSDEAAALNYIVSESKKVAPARPLTEKLDGEYSRVHLSWLGQGLSPVTLARIFCLSSRSEADGKQHLLALIREAKALDIEDFDAKLEQWSKAGYPPVHHSERFRSVYKPAYRVVLNSYAALVPLLARIDALAQKGRVIVAIEGGSAAGKTTAAELLKQVYGCSVFHTDDFFLRPEQRSPERLAQTGGNIDWERMNREVITPLTEGKTVLYRPYDCGSATLGSSIAVDPAPVTVVEGVYAMHSEFKSYYHCAVFLDIAPQLQRDRILKRNSPAFAQRFFDEWIPKENEYFTQMNIKKQADIILPVE